MYSIEIFKKKAFRWQNFSVFGIIHERNICFPRNKKDKKGEKSMTCDSIKIIQELENMFESENDKKTLHKLKIIEYYINFFCIHQKSFSELIEKVKETPELHYLKPSRIKTIIEAYINSESNSGYIQPIGKDLFLERFLSRYPTPLMVQLSEDDWTINSLQNFIKTKYNCNITTDTIRKKLSKYKNFYDNKVKLGLKESIPIYVILLYKNPFPIRKECGKNLRATRYLSLSWCIWGYIINENIDIVYREEPISYINYDYNNEFLNLDYLFQIPIKTGIFLFADTEYSREIFPKYYRYLSKNKINSNYEAYILPDSYYYSVNSLMKNKLKLIYGFIPPILTYSIPRPPDLPEFYQLKDILKMMKNNPNLDFDFLFNYYIEKEKISIPKIFKSKQYL